MPLSFDITFHKAPRKSAETALATIMDGNKLSPAAKALDKEHDGLITAVLKRQKKFTGKKGQITVLTTAPKSPIARIILIGTGDPKKLDGMAYEELGGKLYAALSSAGVEQANLFADNEDMAVRMAAGLALRSYKFDKYKSKGKNDLPPPKSVGIICDTYSAAKKTYSTYSAMIEGVFWARDLLTEPANMLYPDSYAKIIKAELKPLGVDIEIIDEKKMEKLGFYAHLAVAQGAENPARVVIMRWNGSGKKKDKKFPLALVGKGVTFDAGGVNLKPGGEFLNIMKMDMGGSAAVVGAMKSLALRKAKTDVVAIVALAENRMSHNCYLPGDVIKTMAGKTIEIHNTDAEGRLLLADSLTYVQKTYTPAMIIDVATLTGAVLAVFGNEYAGAFANDDKMWKGLDKAGEESGDKLWRLPLHETYRKAMKGTITDFSNLGSLTPHGGTCTAAGFLEQFIDEGRKWAHLDIAGTAWTKTDRPTCPKMFTGFGARLIDRFVAENLEK